MSIVSSTATQIGDLLICNHEDSEGGNHEIYVIFTKETVVVDLLTEQAMQLEIQLADAETTEVLND
jgi:hypothetical protein